MPPRLKVPLEIANDRLFSAHRLPWLLRWLDDRRIGLVFYDSDLCDANGQEVALGKDPLTYCAIMRADLNGDGVINRSDLSLFAQQFDQTVPPAPVRVDQNGDGIINSQGPGGLREGV